MIEFQDKEIKEAWDDILGKDRYRLALTKIADTYPDMRSLEVEFNDIDAYSTDFSIFLLEYPDRCLNMGKVAIKAAMPPDWDDTDTVNLRITKLPHDAKVEIRHLRAKHLGKLVAVEGLARKVTTVKPRLVYAIFTCARCNSIIPVRQDSMFLKEPLMCPNPNGTCNKQGNRLILDVKESKYIDTQKVEIQESPEGLRGGAQPERLTAYIEDDISGAITAGNRITLNGIIRSADKKDKDKSNVFETYIEVLSLEFEEHEYDEINITEEDEMAIRAMSKDPNLYNNIVASISPTIYGMNEVKGAIALQLFGGCRKTMDDGTTVRGDMHVLLIGDPGVAKSQILRYMSMLAPRGIYASGKSASAAGLTAAAVKDEFGDGRWTLEAGALVLADKGLACIDELDKMADQDRSSLHEAMESQRISVSKAGITATLQCRCSMLAAANPKFGRFDTEGSSIASQINLPPALMSRFDMIFVLTDKPESKMDRNITEHILSVHRRGEARMIPEETIIKGVDLKKIKDDTENVCPFYDIETLRKYVAYSKRITPVMTDSASKIIEESYLNIRAKGNGDDESVPITARQLEAFVRLSEASARMRLSETVDDVDANKAVDMVEYYLNKIAGNGSGGFDIDMVSSDFTHRDRSDISVIAAIIKSSPSTTGVPEEEIITAAEKEGLDGTKVKSILKKLINDGTLYRPKNSDEYKMV